MLSRASFLHVFHHSSITIVVAIAVQFDSSGDLYLAALLNSWVHVLMYGHYFLTSIGSKASAPLRPYLTSLQLIQFLIILGQNMASLYYGNDCGFAQWHNLVMVTYMISMLVRTSHTRLCLHLSSLCVSVSTRLWVILLVFP